MKKWSKINVVSSTPKKEEKKKEIDWLEVVEQVKRECRIKTEAPIVDYSKPIIHLSNKTESLDLI